MSNDRTGPPPKPPKAWAEHPASLSGGPPASFLPATWRGTIPPSGTPPRMGVSFNRPDGTVTRLALPVHCARQLAESILDYLNNSHSFSSEEMPSLDVSTRDEGAQT